ncbi:MAG TPA: GNAT family N-acetyltransferase [Alphaproteobacteria bacterium]|nr:GNAT family N-acetyltransferase [Alphaproteobacteria bacterium]
MALEFPFTTKNGIRVIITRRDALIPADLLYTGHEFVVVLEDDPENPIGSLMLHLPIGNNRKRAGIIKKIEIDESYRWIGIGKKLFGLAIDMMAIMKLRDIETEANSASEKDFYMSMQGVPLQSPRGDWPVLFRWDMRDRPMTVH